MNTPKEDYKIMHEKVMLEKIHYYVTNIIPKVWLQDLRYQEMEDVSLQNIIQKIQYNLYGRKDKKYITFPSSPWQHLKENMYCRLPWKITRFLQKKFPVKYIKYDVERTVVFPEIPPIPHGEPIITFNIMKEDVTTQNERY